VLSDQQQHAEVRHQHLDATPAHMPDVVLPPQQSASRQPHDAMMCAVLMHLLFPCLCNLCCAHVQQCWQRSTLVLGASLRCLQGNALSTLWRYLLGTCFGLFFGMGKCLRHCAKYVQAQAAVQEDAEEVEAAVSEAWEDAGLVDEAPSRAKGSRTSFQKKRKVFCAPDPKP